MSPTLNASPTLFVIPCKVLGGLWIYNVAIIGTVWVIFHSTFNHPWQYIITSCWQEKVGFWPMDECTHPSSMTMFVHLYIKKCHMKSYHSDIKYHMTLNIISSVVFPRPTTLNRIFNGWLYRMLFPLYPCSTPNFNSSIMSARHKCAATFPTATSLHVKHGCHTLTNIELKHVTSTYYNSWYLVFELTFNDTYFHRVMDI